MLRWIVVSPGPSLGGVARFVVGQGVILCVPMSGGIFSWFLILQGVRVSPAASTLSGGTNGGM